MQTHNERTIVVASRNAKKAAEIADLLAPFGIAVKSLAAFPDAPEIVEDGETFAANAAKKAQTISRHLGCWTIGEDSGIQVDALKGAPSVYSARYAGEHATDDENNAKLMRELANVPPEKRGAGYVCHVALADPAGEIRLSIEATCRGRLTSEPCGTNGFGYDPYFLILEYHKTFGELDPAVKRHISHRARAFERFIPRFITLWQSE